MLHLEIANTGDLKAFSDYLGRLGLVTLADAVTTGRTLAAHHES